MSDRKQCTEREDCERPLQNRRDALATAAKFAAFVAPASIVLLSADQAKASHGTCNSFQFQNGHPNCPP